MDQMTRLAEWLQVRYGNVVIVLGVLVLIYLCIRLYLQSSRLGRALEATREELKVSSVHSGKAGEFFGYFASGAEVRELPRCKLVGSTGQIGLSESMAIALPKAFGIRTPIVCPHHDDVQ